MIKLEKAICPHPIALERRNYKHPKNKAALRQSSFDKCMYCESLISHTYHGDVEHIIPKSIRAELTYDWNNLGFVCAVCNVSKGNKYDPDLEIINPYIEDPSCHLLAAGPFLFQKQGSERGELTILDVGLNRHELIQRRQDLIERISKAITAAFRTQNDRLRTVVLSELKNEANHDKEYSFVVRHFLEAHHIL